jgi:hypothetical protein
MTPLEKTSALVRKDIDITLLDPNPDNPNEMNDDEFNKLAENMELVGFVDPVFVKPYLRSGEARYRIIGGHHRVEVGKVLGFLTVPCTVIDDPEFDEDAETFQLVRMNTIRGHNSPEKFFKLYQKLQGKYADEVMREQFAITQQDEWDRLVKKVAKELPVEVQKDFEKAAEGIKTVDGLSKLLNTMFSKYGDTLPYGYLIIEYGKKESVWLRMEPHTRKAIGALGKLCVEQSRTMDAIVGGLIRLAADGKLPQVMVQLIAESVPVVIHKGLPLPTEEEMAKHLATPPVTAC